MAPHPAETSLVFFSFSVVALYAPALLLGFLGFLFFSRKKTRLERKLQKHRRIRDDIAARGQARRKKLAVRHQRKNIRELAELVRTQLEEKKPDMTPYLHQRTSVFIEKAVTTIDFDRLYALHTFFAGTREKQLSPVMELFFEQVR
ncbi:hypothetical protein DFW101_3338 [Solidesulfovibrio carbinoliphilus subsp. oakridgensis]|uniref:Uncharacterized protein n=1 Tax=Solidesulfovibrio carbinoliphilus subsp. oakridgensis TaxID=694327 RepID=G7QBB4_9BACT|nr:hypothetical protein [Solidesulfovibrio carbinoliphilus]EHJ49337.1 hypothetical protein DFW101_3338 [Solidesulfovibrio carbinoliphilus subsp. oakridgensis]